MLIHSFATVKPEQVLRSGKMAYSEPVAEALASGMQR
jgi:hypothetical protein